MTETRSEKFRRLRDNRLPNTLKQIELLGNLSNRYTYDFSTSEAREVVTSIQLAVDQLKEAFGLLDTSEPSPEPLPEPLPETEEDTPPEVVNKNSGPYTRGWAAWALDKLQTNNVADAKDFLKRALKGDKY